MIHSIVPAHGVAGQGVVLSISGAGFGIDSQAWFAYKSVATSWTSSTSVQATIPGGLIPTPGPYAVIVMSGGQQSPDAIWTATLNMPPDPPPPGDDARQQVIDLLADAGKRLETARALVEKEWR